MRLVRLIGILVLLQLMGCTLPGAVPSAAVYFNLQNLASLPPTNRTVLIIPTELTSSAAIPVVDVIRTNTGATGAFWVSNMLAGTYTLEVQAPPTTTRLQFYVDSTNAVQYARSNLVAQIATNPSLFYTKTQVDALINDAVSGGIVAGGSTNMDYASATNFMVRSNLTVSGEAWFATLRAGVFIGTNWGESMFGSAQIIDGSLETNDLSAAAIVALQSSGGQYVKAGSNVTASTNANVVTISAAAASVDYSANHTWTGSNHYTGSLVVDNGGTNQIAEAVFSAGVTLGGERRTTWPTSSVDTNANYAWAGTNVFAKTISAPKGIATGAYGFDDSGLATFYSVASSGLVINTDKFSIDSLGNVLVAGSITFGGQALSSWPVGLNTNANYSWDGTNVFAKAISAPKGIFSPGGYGFDGESGLATFYSLASSGLGINTDKFTVDSLGNVLVAGSITFGGQALSSWPVGLNTNASLAWSGRHTFGSNVVVSPTYGQNTPTFQVLQTNGSVVFSVNSTNAFVGIGTAFPTKALSVNGAIGSAGDIEIGRTDALYHKDRNRWYSSADGAMRWTDSTGTNVLMANTNGSLHATSFFGQLPTTNLLQEVQTFPSATNAMALTGADGQWLLVSTSDCSVTNVTGITVGQARGGELVVSNSVATNITLRSLFCGRAVGIGTTNALVIAPGKMGFLNVRAAFGVTNYITAVEQ